MGRLKEQLGYAEKEIAALRERSERLERERDAARCQVLSFGALYQARRAVERAKEVAAQVAEQRRRDEDLARGLINVADYTNGNVMFSFNGAANGQGSAEVRIKMSRREADLLAQAAGLKRKPYAPVADVPLATYFSGTKIRVRPL